MRFEYHDPFGKKSFELKELECVRHTVVEKISLEEAEEVPNGKVDYISISEGDWVSFPDMIHQIKLRKITFPNGIVGYYMVNTIRNCSGSWLCLSTLTKKNYNEEPIHPVSEYLMECSSLAEIILAMLGKTIVCNKMVEYTIYKYENGVRTNELRTVKSPYLEFL